MITKRASIIALLLILGTACSLNQFIHNSIPVQEQITLQLENISKSADEALTLKIFTIDDRKVFAQNVMLPVIAANKQYAQCLLSGTCANLIQIIQQMVHSLQIGIDSFISKMAITPTTDKLRLALTTAITFVNNLQYKGGK